MTYRQQRAVAGWTRTTLAVLAFTALGGCSAGGYFYGRQMDEKNGVVVSHEDCEELRASLPIFVEVVRANGANVRGELIETDCSTDSSIVVVPRLAMWTYHASTAADDTLTISASQLRHMTTPRKHYRYLGLVGGILADVALYKFAEWREDTAPH